MMRRNPELPPPSSSSRKPSPSPHPPKRKSSSPKSNQLRIGTLRRNDQLSFTLHSIKLHARPSVDSPVVSRVEITPAFFSKSNPFKWIEQGQYWNSGSTSQSSCLSGGLWILVAGCSGGGWLQATSPNRVFCLPHSCYGSLFHPTTTTKSETTTKEDNLIKTTKKKKNRFPPRLIGAELVRWRNCSSSLKTGSGGGGEGVPIYTSPNLNSQILGKLSHGESIVGTGRLQHQTVVVASTDTNNHHHHHHRRYHDSLASSINEENQCITSSCDINTNNSVKPQTKLHMTFVECLMPTRMLLSSSSSLKNNHNKNKKSASKAAHSQLHQQKQLVFLPIGDAAKGEALLKPELFVPGLDRIAATLPNAWRVIPNQFVIDDEDDGISKENNNKNKNKNKKVSCRPPPPPPAAVSPDENHNDNYNNKDDVDEYGGETCLAFSRSRISPQRMMLLVPPSSSGMNNNNDNNVHQRGSSPSPSSSSIVMMRDFSPPVNQNNISSTPSFMSSPTPRNLLQVVHHHHHVDPSSHLNDLY